MRTARLPTVLAMVAATRCQYWGQVPGGLGIPTPLHDTYRLGYLTSLDPYHPRRDLGREIPLSPPKGPGTWNTYPQEGTWDQKYLTLPRTDTPLWQHTFPQLSLRELIIKIKTTLPPANNKDVNAIEVKLGHWRRENATDWKTLYNISENPSTSCHSVSICQRIDILNSFHGTKSIRSFHWGCFRKKGGWFDNFMAQMDNLPL